MTHEIKINIIPVHAIIKTHCSQFRQLNRRLCMKKGLINQVPMIISRFPSLLQLWTLYLEKDQNIARLSLHAYTYSKTYKNLNEQKNMLF